MVLARKGSRVITVDGLAYRWRVRKRPAYATALAQTPLSFAVERAGRRGAVLIATMPAAHPANWLHAASAPVIPAIVAAVIRQAQAHGWDPERPGPVFPFAVGEDIWTETTGS